MEKQIILQYQPFVVNQPIMVFDGSECIDSALVPYDRVVETIKGLCNEYSVQHIKLSGNIDFLSKTKEEMLNTYENTTIEII